MSDGIDWRRVAVQLFRSDGMCWRLTTPERDALERADAELPDDLSAVGRMQVDDAREHGGYIG